MILTTTFSAAPFARFAGAIAVACALLTAQSAFGQVATAASNHHQHAAARHHVRTRVRVSRRRVHAHRHVTASRVTPLAPAAAAPAQPAAPAATAACHDTNLVPTSANASQIAAATLCLVNAQRALHGEVALRENVHLDSAAAHHSQDMVSADYFAHVSPSGETPLDRIVASHYVPDTAAYEVGENLVLGTLDLATPSAIISGWMNSSEHRTNILNASFRDTGIGVVTQVPAQYSSGQTGAVVTQEFGVVQAP